MFGIIATIAAKDLKRRLKDGSLLLFGLVLPVGLALLFSSLLGDGAQEGRDIRYLVVDSDGGELAAVFVDEVLTPLDEDGVITLGEEPEADAARAAVDEREYDAAFIVPEGFSAAVMAGEDAEIGVIGSADAAVQVQIAREIAESFATEADAARAAVASALEAGAAATPEELSARVQDAPVPVALEEVPTETWRELDTATYHAAGMAYFFLFFVVMSSVTALLDERSGGTLARHLAAPIRRSSLLAGRALSATVVGSASLLALAFISGLVLGAQWGPLPGVLALTLAGVLAAVGITSAVAAFSTSSEQAGNRISVLAFVLGLLGGALFPVARLGAFSAISLATPHHWFLTGLAELSGGSGGAVATSVLVLAGMAVATGALAFSRAGRMLTP
ncbi:ABC transporter permease [Nocardiopsis changdeensis]|uniref:ABC transporter permease n=1 Tax=Nocardiopsis changdeensis TaxID=2831969 RepID=UPI003F472AD0